MGVEVILAPNESGSGAAGRRALLTRLPPLHRLKQAWRHAALAGLAAGLGLAPFAQVSVGRLGAGLVVLAFAAPALALARPRGPAAGAARLLLITVFAALLGLAIGSLRLAAIDMGALRGPTGSRVELEGHLTSVPRPDSEGLAAELESSVGRVLLRGPDLGDASIGDGLSARGSLAVAPPWRSGTLARKGISMVLEADRIEPTGERRGGLAGRVDAIRERAERALERGMPEREAALARGFVLGEDDRIDPDTRDDFRRSGLAHLLAVSGQNVILLCLLAWPLLALCGLTLRARLIALLVLVAIYVPVTGAGASIQRAAVMGGAGLVAALADRPSSRWYALLLAAAVTLAVNPRAAGDVGWQLSFAAVAGILLWTARLASLLDAGGERGSPRRAAAEGVAMTAAATFATAPLMAHHFGALSVAALPANALALPAVAPAMWLGMLAGMAGQLPALPVEPLNWLNSLCLAYISQVAHWLGSPGWAQVDVELGGPLAVAASYLALIALFELILAAARRRRGLGLHRARRSDGRRGAARALAAVGAAAIGISLLAGARGQPRSVPPKDHLVVRVLDVGQGDSILLDPPEGEPVLVDAGPADADVAGRLRELGVTRLAAVMVTHDQSDHAGGVAGLLRSIAVRRLLLAQGSSRLSGLAAAADAEPLRASEGEQLRSGGLRLTVLWPPRTSLGAAEEDPNRLSLVLVAEWRHFSILLTGDAEAEAAPIDPGPIDVLKVAHHGSEDAGLDSLLDHAAPKLAVISVGENSYGHPTRETLGELAGHGVPVVRTDEQGEVAIEADASGWWLTP